MQQIQKFWMVYCIGNNAPRVQHGSQAEAEREARRLAVATKQQAVVLAAVKAFAPREDWVEIEVDDIPF